MPKIGCGQSLIDERLPDSLRRFLRLCGSAGADVRNVERVARGTVKHLQGSGNDRASTGALQALERRWYDSLRAGSPDWSVYEAEEYLGDLWACWAVYSRQHLRSLRKIRGRLGAVRSLTDLGCGVGLTTAALKEMFPEAVATATNVGESPQTRAAALLAAEAGFSVKPLSAVGQVDLVFASEYFEHFERPVTHLREVLAETEPAVLAAANSFGADSIGHFRSYEGGLNARLTSRAFAAEMRAAGFVKMETGFWNNRPAVWMRKKPRRRSGARSG